MEHVIVCDYHENMSSIPAIIEQLGAPTELEDLMDGDYRIDDWLFSRKTITDLIRSRNSAHLQDELVRLVVDYRRYMLIIEEDLAATRSDISVASKMVDSLCHVLPIRWTKGQKHTAEVLVHYKDLIERGKLGTILYKPVIEGASNPIIGFYMGLPGVGLKAGKSLYDKYPKPIDFIKAVRETYRYDDILWRTKKQWKKERWNANVTAIGDGRFEEINGFILDGIYEKKSRKFGW